MREPLRVHVGRVVRQKANVDGSECLNLLKSELDAPRVVSDYGPMNNAPRGQRAIYAAVDSHHRNSIHVRLSVSSLKSGIMLRGIWYS